MSALPQELLTIRAMASTDVDAVTAIECASYRFPWTQRVFEDCLRAGYRCLVALDAAENIIGYSLLSIVLDESHVLNLCVDPACRRRGVARLLLDRMLYEAAEVQVRTMLLEVRPSNRGARALYADYGFKRLATRPAYYPADDGREDAWLLSRRVSRPV